MAIPGETVCHSLVSCGTHKWGEIAVEPDTEFVDKSYAGGDSDGSSERPWTTIQQGVVAAASHAIVAIAAGEYVEDLFVIKPVRLWGRCPDLVTIVGTRPAAAPGAAILFFGADGAELRGVHVRGAGYGVAVVGSQDVRIDAVHLSDTAASGILVERTTSRASATITHTLVERAGEIGMGVLGSELQVEASVVRDTLPSSTSQLFGRGIDVEYVCTAGDCGADHRGRLVLTRSVVERNSDVGVYGAGSDLTIESTVVRDTQPRAADGRSGRGLDVVDCGPASGCPTDEAGLLELKSSWLARNQESGVALGGSQASIQHTVVRDTRPSLVDAGGGFGIMVQISCPPSGCIASARSTALIQTSLVESNTHAGIVARGSDITVESTAVQHTAPLPTDQQSGRGISVEDCGPSASVIGAMAGCEEVAIGRAAVRGSLVAHNHEIGIYVGGAELAMEATVVRDTLPSHPEARGGTGLNVQIACPSAAETCPPGGRSTATVVASIIERNSDLGVFVFASDLQMQTSVVRDTRPLSNGLRGRGINIADCAEDLCGQRVPSNAHIERTLIDDNREVGLFVGGSTATIETSVVRGTRSANQTAGVVIQFSCPGEGDVCIVEASSSATLRHTLIADNSGTGLAVLGSHALLADCAVHDTLPEVDGLFGDGISVYAAGGTATLELERVRAERSSRGGLALFGADVTYRETSLVCQAIDIIVEADGARPPSLDNAGANACGCPEAAADCIVESPGLEPSQPFPAGND